MNNIHSPKFISGVFVHKFSAALNMQNALMPPSRCDVVRVWPRWSQVYDSFGIILFSTPDSLAVCLSLYFNSIFHVTYHLAFLLLSIASKAKHCSMIIVFSLFHLAQVGRPNRVLNFIPACPFRGVCCCSSYVEPSRSLALRKLKLLPRSMRLLGRPTFRWPNLLVKQRPSTATNTRLSRVTSLRCYLDFKQWSRQLMRAMRQEVSLKRFWDPKTTSLSRSGAKWAKEVQIRSQSNKALQSKSQRVPQFPSRFLRTQRRLWKIRHQQGQTKLQRAPKWQKLQRSRPRWRKHRHHPCLQKNHQKRRRSRPRWRKHRHHPCLQKNHQKHQRSRPRWLKHKHHPCLQKSHYLCLWRRQQPRQRKKQHLYLQQRHRLLCLLRLLQKQHLCLWGMQFLWMWQMHHNSRSCPSNRRSNRCSNKCKMHHRVHRCLREGLDLSGIRGTLGRFGPSWVAWRSFWLASRSCRC